MFGRPRCREWTPLATQQLRLRSLIQIVGYNIRPPEGCISQCSFYITLHHTTMSAPFYTSERISSPHPKWKEIDSEVTQRMSSTNIVIRIWIHHGNAQDAVIQTWGVYLSGLRYIGANLASNFNSDCFKCNTLVFQMHGGYFCSYKSLKLDIIPPENELEHSSLSSDSSGRTNVKALDPKIHKAIKESRSISPSKYPRKIDREYSKSQSPDDRGFQQKFPTLRASASLNISKRNEDVDPSNIYEHSPENLDVNSVNCDNLSKDPSQDELLCNIDLSETAENYDLRNDTDRVPKYRYLALNFLKSEIRPSYNAAKLQKLHLLQYSIKKRQEAVQEIKERIYKNSAVSDSWSQNDGQVLRVKGRSRSQRNLFSPEEGLSKDKSCSQSDLYGRIKEDKPVLNGPRLALKLNDLLSFKTKTSPYQRAEHVRLTKQLEILRFKRIILSDERDSKLANIRRLKERHAKLAEENQDVGTELMQGYHTLSKSSDSVTERGQSLSALRELTARSHAALRAATTELLAQLHHIFYIQQINPITWSIIGVPLTICGDESPRTNPMSDAVACGYAAQATCIAAALLGQPLRYKITLLGSATKITDVTPDLPDPNIPLYSSGGDATLFRYAMFLLNKCIGQLCAGRGLPIADIRPTLLNLERVLTSTPHLSESSNQRSGHHWFSESQCPRTQSLRSLVAGERGGYRQFNRFKDAVDGQPPPSVLVRSHRHSRSVGSYRDDRELSTLDASTTSIMGSESNIYTMKLIQNETAEAKLKTTSSDSEISKMADEPPVIFTLGDDSTLIGLDSQLVRISTNNRDECSSCLDDNVKKVCSEITDFCSKDIHEGFDVAKYMEIRDGCVSEMEDICVSCESGMGDTVPCASVTDVIVIPSAEAILDTGQKNQDGADS